VNPGEDIYGLVGDGSSDVNVWIQVP